MTARTRTAKKTADTPAPARKTAVKKTTAAASRPPRKRTPRKQTPGAPKLSLVKTPKPAEGRDKPFMTDTQGFATLAARIVGIPTVNIRDWRDHRNGTCTRPLRDGSTLHYDLTTRTLTWQAVCRMGAVHQYELNSPSMACAARLHADGCTTLHADLSTVKPLTPDELEALGLLQTPTWARPDLIGDDFTDTKIVPLPGREPRALADTLTHSDTGAAETQPMSKPAIAEGLAARAAAADTETAKEHPQP
ncbi:hypothetical protein [Streptomyces sp. NBC_00847]|uniref:hypothetical protein n=1 Tax=Streptomyces sp. NBC_00847 TaxID=2975850 RepID=UPI00225E1D7B|nr:hypothetical protein [Streptomyces sp. NBC_00847]MCX4885938.1 hypothetical protein [Streptomyces sp. NBC_00847]